MRSKRNPLRSVSTLREAMDRLLEDSFVQPLRSAIGSSTDGVPVDLVDAGDRYEVRAALPGVQPDDLHVQIQGDLLTLRGTPKPPGRHASEHPERWLIRELRQPAFERQIHLPEHVQADQAQAHLEHGLLTLTLPKLQTVAPRRIEISRPSLGGTREARAEGQNPSVVDPTKPEVAPGVMPATEPSLASDADRPHKDQVTVESEQSFPSSDPPSWTPERA
jgi:HSP20 family protein